MIHDDEYVHFGAVRVAQLLLIGILQLLTFVCQINSFKII